MALGIVQAGYRNSLCMYAAQFLPESEISYEELLAELTTGLELAYQGEDEEPVTDEEAGEENRQPEILSNKRKEEWEEILEQSVVVEVMLRQMLENGLGQKDASGQEPPKKNSPENLDNDFDMGELLAVTEGKSKNSSERTEMPGNSEFLQTNSGNGAEYFSPSGAGRRQKLPSRIICLTCETECERKKQWNIIE